MFRYLLFIAFILRCGFSWSQQLSPTDKKIATPLRQVKSGFTSVRILVNDKRLFDSWLLDHFPKLIANDSKIKNLVELKLSAAQLRQLAACPHVSFIDVAGRAAKEERSLDNFDISVNRVNKVHSDFPDLNGDNLTVSIKEKPFDLSDIDFKGRTIASADFDEPATTHATNMATIIAGGGNSSAKGKGVAWSAQLTTSDFTELLPDNADLLESAGISVQNHSYGVGIENYYGIEAQAYDEQVAEYPQLVHVFSSGNEGASTAESGIYKDAAGFANLTGQFKMSKNTLSVGSVNDIAEIAPLSSRGPAHDGRIKPELVAFGDSGSSESAAVVSGISLLLQQAYFNQTGLLPPASLVKAILINSADDLGRPNVDYESGFGNANALNTVRTINEGRYFLNSLLQDEVKTYSIAVPANCKEVKVTLTWTDPAADANADFALVNDLDLTLTEINSGAVWKPWVLNHYPHADSLRLPARQQVDTINNVEQVSVADPAAGVYEIRVLGSRVTNAQLFSIAYQFNTEFEWSYPSRKEKILSGSPIKIRWQNFTPAASGRIELKTSAGEWTEIVTNADLKSGYYEWNVPAVTSKAQLRMITDTWTVVSDTFLISFKPDLQVGFNCDEEAMLFWRPHESTYEFELFVLGEKFMEPFAAVKDTFFILDQSQKQNTFYAITPLVEGWPGYYSTTVDYTLQGVGCYLKSFLPREVVTDSVLLDAELSARYKLSEITLQRLEGGTFIPIHSQPITSLLRFVFHDPNPFHGANTYRLELKTIDQKNIYSQTEQVFFVPVSEVLLFPNPVTVNEPVSLAVEEEEPITIVVYDAIGRRVYEMTDSGEILSIPSPPTSGSYFIKLSTSKHQWTARLMVR